MDGFANLRRKLRHPASPWTRERIAHLKSRWRQGVPARRIAWELGGGISRDAVLGKIRRLGFAAYSSREWVHRLQRGRGGDHVIVRQVPAGCLLGGSYPSQQWLVPAWVIEARPYVDDPGIDADIPCGQRRSLLELTDGICRWPVGDPSHPDFFFCGADAQQDQSYCAAHATRARRSTAHGSGRGTGDVIVAFSAIPAPKLAMATNEAERGDE